MPARAAGDEPHMPLERVLLTLCARPYAAVTNVPALLIDPKEIHVLTELVDEFQTRFLARVLRGPQLDFRRGGLQNLFFRQTEFFERGRGFSRSRLRVDPNERMAPLPCLHAIPKHFAIRQPVGLHAVTKDRVLGALREVGDLGHPRGHGEAQRQEEEGWVHVLDERTWNTG